MPLLSFVWVLLCVGAHKGTSVLHMWKTEITLVSIPQMPSSFSFRADSLIGWEFTKTTRLASKPQGSACLGLPSTGIESVHPMPTFFELVIELRVSCACKVTTLPTESLYF